MAEYRVGDAVVLRAGDSPVMLAEMLEESGGNEFVHVIWFHGEESAMKREKLPAALLRHATDDDTPRRVGFG